MEDGSPSAERNAWIPRIAARTGGTWLGDANRNIVPRMCWLTFQGSDGRVGVEMLAPATDFADLVDPNDGSVLHLESFAMHGGEWKIESVTVADDLIRIGCISAATQVPPTPANSNSGSSIRR